MIYDFLRFIASTYFWPAIGLFILIAILLSILCWFPKWQSRHIPLKDRPSLENEFRKTLAQIIGGAAVIFGLYSGWQQLQATGRSLQIAQEGQITERYTRAIDQLGSKALHVRIGGIYALGEISNTSEHDHYWSVIDVLAAFIRDKAAWKDHTGKQTPGKTEDGQQAAEGDQPKERLSEDVQAALSVIAKQNTARRMKSDRHLVNLSSTDLRYADLQHGVLTQVQLVNSHLEFSEMTGAHLEKADLSGAHLEEATLEGADLDEANLRGAELGRAILTGASLKRAELRGAFLAGANLIDANLEGASFDDAHFEGAQLDRAHLEGANLHQTKGLRAAQIRLAITDKNTILPDNLN